MRNISSIVLGSILLFAGCKNPQYASQSTATTVRSNSTTWVVTVGMEYSTFAGACPGSGIDAKRMTSLLSNYSDHVASFSNDTATKDNVKKAMIEAATNAELFIFYYSGHGGQQRFWDTGSDEDDGKDEFLCLYDTYMRDNEIWEIINKCKGRVMCIFDACHSQSMFRVPTPITIRRQAIFAATHTVQGNVNLLVWSGCPDDTYSYGSASGGMMTNTLLKYFDGRKTYDYLWKEIENDSGLKKSETVQRTIIGGGFSSRPIFR